MHADKKKDDLPGFHLEPHPLGNIVGYQVFQAKESPFRQILNLPNVYFIHQGEVKRVEQTGVTATLGALDCAIVVAFVPNEAGHDVWLAHIDPDVGLTEEQQRVISQAKIGLAGGSEKAMTLLEGSKKFFPIPRPEAPPPQGREFCLSAAIFPKTSPFGLSPPIVLSWASVQI